MIKPIAHPLRRRRFLQQASTFAIGATFGGSISGRAFAQDATTSVVTRLSTSVAGAFGKQVVTLAFGQIMSAIGIDTTGAAAMQGELDQIIADLQVLQTMVEELKSQLRVGLANLDFNGALAPVLQLIAANEDIADSFRVLLSLSPTSNDTPDEAAGKIAEIAVQKQLIGRKITPEYQAGLRSWSNAILGLHDQPSLIKTWSTLVAARSGIFFGWTDARKIQAGWDFIDAHQALTASFLVDYYNGLGAHGQAKATLMEWYRSRRQQLPLLRGGTRREDRFTVSDGRMGQRTEVTQLNSLPEKTMIHQATGLMWYLEAEVDVTARIYQAPGTPPPNEFWTETDLTKITGRPRYHEGYRRNPDLGNNQPPDEPPSYDPGPWIIPDDSEFRALVSACGGTLHTDNDKFMGAMREKGGFIFPAGNVGVFLRSGSYKHAEGGFPPYGFYRNMYREGTNALDPADWRDCCDQSTFGRGWGGTAKVLLYRRAIGDEAYWYPA